MKVLMTADTVGGVWTYAMELAGALEPHGVEVVLATMGMPLSPGQRTQARARANVRVVEGRYRLEWMADPWLDVRRAGAWLLELEARERPDVVHLNGYAHGALRWRAPVCVVAHSCVLSWWRAVKGTNAPPEWDAYRTAVRRGLDGADLVIAPTRAMLAALAACHGVVPRARVIPNARDASRFAAAAAKRPLVLAAGRLWDEAKNVSALDRVAPELPWPVYIAGDARGPDGVERTFGAARALGRLDEAALANWMGAAEIFVLPARYEPFGLGALEAALAGCALVLGDIPSLREVWGDAALFVPPGDDGALAGALRALIADDARRERLARAARERAGRYAPAAMAREYLAAYAELRERRPGPAEAACAS
ncbi:MAG TPA: glycosyltransferase family 4 protein [Gemmatimonadaceae bacterium]|nr:glycosyltransferase family 4 protein [Gemmatimonadaceae bacterium]